MIRQVDTIILGPRSLLREGIRITMCRSRYKLTAAVEAASEITPEGWTNHHFPSVTIILAPGSRPVEIETTVKSLREARPLECIVVLCESADDHQVGVLQAGAMACLPHTISPDILIMSLDLLLAKALAMTSLNEPIPAAPPVIASNRAHGKPGSGALESQGISGLTRRETDVLRAIASGASNKCIANSLSMREPTVKSHMRLILKKIGMTNRTQAAIWALEHGFADRTEPPIAAPLKASR